MSISNPGESGFDPHALTEKMYGSVDMQPAFLRSVFGARVDELCAYVDREAAAYALHHGLGELAAQGTDVREQRHVKAHVIYVTRHFPQIDYDPEPGNSRARRTVVLSEEYALVTEESSEGGDSFPVMKRNIMPVLTVVPLPKPGNYNPQPEARYERTDLMTVDNVLRGRVPERGGVIDLFLTKPSDDPGLLRRKQEQYAYIGWLRKVALHLGRDGMLMQPYRWLETRTSQN